MTAPAKTQGSSPPSETSTPPNSAKGPFASTIPKATQKLWDRMSADLRKNPEANWEAALKNSDELARSVCGSQNIDSKVQTEILLNINMLERTLLGLNFATSDHLEKTHGRIKEELGIFRLDVATNAEHLKKIDSLKNDRPST